MFRFNTLSRALTGAAAASLLMGCPKLNKGTKEDSIALPEIPLDATPVESTRATAGIIDVQVELRSDGMLLRLGNVPEGAVIECDLDEQPLVPCHDQALFARPSEGEHKITVVALINNAPVAFGESETFVVVPGTGGEFDESGNPRNPYTVIMNDPNFKTDQPYPMSQDFVAKFRLARASSCEVQFRCSYDSRTNHFWTACSDMFTVKSAMMALGRQHLSVQAACGDELGPILTIAWDGVPDGYAPLMLNGIKDAMGRTLVELVRPDDCPGSEDGRFECAAANSDEFVACDSNVFDHPPAGTRVRYSCAGTAGPELILSP